MVWVELAAPRIATESRAELYWVSEFLLGSIGVHAAVLLQFAIFAPALESPLKFPNHRDPYDTIDCITM